MAIDLIVELFHHGTPPTYKLVAFVGVSFASIALPIVVIMKRLRTVLRLGYGPEDIATALRASYDRRREEFQYVFGTQASIRERTARVVGVAGLATAALMGVGMLAGALGPPIMVVPAALISFGLPVAIGSLYAGVFGTMVSTKWKRLRQGTGSAWAGLWQGAIGQRLAKISGFKLGQRAVPANRPTELAISMSAEALFANFPRELRESLGDVPSALHALEAHARAARAHIAELDATIDQALRGPGKSAAVERQEALAAELRAARAASEARLSDVVTALENVRLNLLRLQAGVGSVDSITQDLEAARVVGDDAARLLAGVHEADEALRK